MISSFLLILTIGVSSPTTTITSFHSVDYYNPKVACETAKIAVLKQLDKYTLNTVKAECVKVDY
jgi:hypothetical protein